MEHLIKGFGYAISTFIVSYIMASFYNTTWNFKLWSEASRMFVSVIVIVVFVLVSSLSYINDETE